MTMAEAIGHPNSLLSSNSSPSTLHSYRPSSEESIIVLSISMMSEMYGNFNVDLKTVFILPF